MNFLLWIALLIITATGGCRSGKSDASTSKLLAESSSASSTPNTPTESNLSEAKILQLQYLETEQAELPDSDETQSSTESEQLEALPDPEVADSEELKDTTELELLAPPDPLPQVTLNDVVMAVYSSYPSLDAAAREQQIAAGKTLSANGEFDHILFSDIMTEPLGYYENYRYGLGVKKYQWNGSQTFAEYRLGRGSFEPWYLERQTNAGGEFKAGVAVPFLRDRDIDKRRAAVFLARLDSSIAQPIFQLEVLDAVQSASLAYWNWVAAGRREKIALQNYELAEKRQSGVQQRVDRGEIAAIELVDNERLIVSRRAKLIESRRKLQQATIKLSLYLRDSNGTPLIVSNDQLPASFPEVESPLEVSEDQQISEALAQRPELRLLSLEQQKQRVEIQQASNLTLPSMTGVISASQDVGEPTSFKRDKSQAELEAGVLMDVPLQRREAVGKLQTARGKLAQLSAKLRLMQNTITAQVQTYRTAFEASFNALEQAQLGAKLAEEMAEAERIRLERGDSDILTVNLREQAAFDAELLAIDAAEEYFSAKAQLDAATAAELVNPGMFLP